jgi:leucyl aminopeptidase (aminopeptidase T)
MATDELAIALQRMFTNNFKREPNESILFIVDSAPEEMKDNITPRLFEIINERAKYVELCAQRAQDLYGKQYVDFKKYPATLQAGKEIPDDVVDAMKEHDIFLAITTFSLSHTRGRKAACEAGARGALMPGFTPDMFNSKRPMAVDHLKMKELGDNLIKQINEIRNSHPEKKCFVKIIDQQENSLQFEIMANNRVFQRDYGLFYEKGDSGNLPAGEVYIAPNEFTAEGKIAIPKEWTKHNEETADTLFLTFKKGQLSEIKGETERLKEILGFHVENPVPSAAELYQFRRNLAEFGIGLNQNATRHDSVVESEKIIGTCHLAIGTNATFGGFIQSDIHFDFIIPGATVLINDTPIIAHGVLLVSENKESCE